MPTDARVLVVENDVRLRNALAELIRSWGYEAESAPDGQQALEKISSFDPVLVVSDLRMPVMGGMDLLKQVRETRPGINFIMLTGHASIDEAVEATKLGAFNFLEKPLNPQRLQVELRNCLERQESERQLEAARRRLRDLGFLGNLVGRSKVMQRVLSLIQQVAPSVASVLIIGESGTVKELAGRAGGGGHQPGAGGGGGGGAVAQRPVLPAQRGADSHAASAGPPGRPGGPGGGAAGGLEPQAQSGHQRVGQRGAGRAPRVFLAGQRPRTSQHAGARRRGVFHR